MKRKTTYFAVLLLVFIMIAGYSRQYIHKSSKLKIILFNENSEKLELEIKEFAKINKIKVEIEKKDFYEVMEIMESKNILDQENTDIYMSVNDWTGEIVEKGLAEKIEDRELEKAIPIVKESLKVGGNYYGYPYRLETVFLYTNKKYIEKPPKDVEELLLLKREIEKKEKKEGLVFPTDEIYYHYPWYKYFGGSVNGLMELNKEDLAMKNEIEFVGRNFKYMNSSVAIQKFKREESWMMINGSWEIEHLEDKYAIEYGMIRDESFKPFLGIKSFVINKKSKNKKLSKKLLKYILDDKSQNFLSKDKWHITPNKNIFKLGINKATRELTWCIDTPEIMPSNAKIRYNCNRAGELFARVVKNRESVEESIEELFGGEK